MKARYGLFLILSFFSLSGCAFTVSKVPLEYRYQGTASQNLTPGTKVRVLPLTDKREVSDPRTIFSKSNSYSKTSGEYRAEQAISEIVTQAISDGLSEAGATVTPDAELVLEGELLKNDYDVDRGFVEGRVKNELQCKLRIRNKNSGELLWQDTISGKYSEDTTWTPASFYAQMMRKTIDNFVAELLQDEYFRQKLSR